MKNYYRFFGAFLDSQENFLNLKASEGFRLVKVGKLSYGFEECSPDEFQYAVDFVGDESQTNTEDYRLFLEELGYKIFYKNINLNYSIGKVKLRPYGKGSGRIATNGTTLDKEILIVEKKNDNKPFQLRTTNEDKVRYYEKLRNMWFSVLCLPVFLSFLCFFQTNSIFSIEMTFVGILIVTSTFPTIRYQRKVTEYKNLSKFEQ